MDSLGVGKSFGGGFDGAGAGASLCDLSVVSAGSGFLIPILDFDGAGRGILQHWVPFVTIEAQMHRGRFLDVATVGSVATLVSSRLCCPEIRRPLSSFSPISFFSSIDRRQTLQTITIFLRITHFPGYP